MRIKHIAIATRDPDKTATFYREALGLREVGRINSPLAEGYYLTDGAINVAILKYKSDAAADVPEGVNFVGLHHIGFKVDNLEEAFARLEAAQAERRPQLYPPTPGQAFEAKFRGPDGVIIDISHTGWPGTEA